MGELQRLGLDEERLTALLKRAAKAQGLSTRTYGESGNRTAYAERTMWLKTALE